MFKDYYLIGNFYLITYKFLIIFELKDKNIDILSPSLNKHKENPKYILSFTKNNIRLCLYIRVCVVILNQILVYLKLV